MVITCPSCQNRYRIAPKDSGPAKARVKCPGCAHIFTISLEQEVPEPPAAPPAAQADSAAEDRPKILIVDDAKFFREMIKDLLADLPAELLTAANGEEAWQTIVTERPRLVLLDINIPGRSGKDILRALRDNRDFDAIRVLVMSGVERGEETAAEMRRAGADDFLNKSFKPRQLEARVRQHLDL